MGSPDGLVRFVCFRECISILGTNKKTLPKKSTFESMIFRTYHFSVGPMFLVPWSFFFNLPEDYNNLQENYGSLARMTLNLVKITGCNAMLKPHRKLGEYQKLM